MNYDGNNIAGKIKNYTIYMHCMERDKRIWYLSLMRAAKVQASLRIRAVSPEPPLLAHTSSESRGTFRQKTRSLAPLNGWACAIKICNDGMLEDTNSLDGARMVCPNVVTKLVHLCTLCSQHNFLLKHKTRWIKWTASSEFGTYRICEQQRFRRAVSPEPSLLAHTSSESRVTVRQKARSLASLNGWACAVKICHDGMLEDTNSLDGAQIVSL